MYGDEAPTGLVIFGIRLKVAATLALGLTALIGTLSFFQSSSPPDYPPSIVDTSVPITEIAQQDSTISEPEEQTALSVDAQPSDETQVDPPAPPADANPRAGPGVLRGKLVDHHGKIVTGARVSMHPVQPSRNRSAPRRSALKTVAEEDGTFEFTGIELGAFTLYAVHDELVGRALFRTTDYQVDLLITMHPGVYVEGRVFDHERLPVSQAKVEVAAFLANGRYIHRTVSRFSSGGSHSLRLKVDGIYTSKTDSKGRFVLGPMTDDMVELYTTHSNLAPQYSSPYPARSKNIRIDLRPAASISGRTLHSENNSPFPRAEIVFSGDTYKEQFSIESDENGNFVLANIPHGTYRVAASRAAPYVVSEPDGLYVEIGGNQTADALEIALAKGGVVRGRVTNPMNNFPISGARLDIGVNLGMNDQQSMALTDSSGRFEFTGLKSGKYQIQFREDSNRKDYPYDSVKRMFVYVKQGDTLDGIEFHAMPTGTITGRVETPDGEPVPLAYVYSQTSENGILQATTNPNGSFVLKNVPANQTLEINSAKGPLSATTEFNPAEDSEDEIVLTLLSSKGDGESHYKTMKEWTYTDTPALPRDQSVYGRVTERNGEPVVGALVSIVQGGWLTAITDVEGRYEVLGLTKSRVHISSISKPGFHRLGSEYNKAITPSLTEADFVLDRVGTIAGRVIDAKTGRPIESFEFFVDLEGNQTAYNDYAHFKQWILGASSLGEFVANSGRVRSYQTLVIARAPGYRQNSVAVGILGPNQKIKDVVIELKPGHLLKGRVTSTDRMPVAGALIYTGNLEELEMVDQYPPRAKSDSQGYYQIDSMPSGENSITLYHDSYSILRTRVHVSEAMDTEQDFTLSNGSTVKGTISQNGAPLQGAYVYMNISGELGSRNVRTSGDGSFTHSSLPPGEVTLRVQGYRQDLVLVEDGDLPIDIDLPYAPSRIDGVVIVDLEENEHLSARCSISVPMGEGFYEVGDWVEDDTKRFSLDQVPAGEYQLRIKADLYRGTVEKYIDVEVGENETLDLTIDLSDATPVVPTQ